MTLLRRLAIPLLLALYWHAAQATPSLPFAPARGPAYGEALFLLDTGDEHGALIRLLAARQAGTLARDGEAARLVLAWLWRLENLPAGNDEALATPMARQLPPRARDAAWLTLGETRLRRGDFSGAAAALAHAGSHLSAEERGRRTVLQADALVALGRGEEAATVLARKVPAPPLWKAYARYNLAMVHLESGQESRALPLLDEVGRMAGEDEALLALRDKANVTLGYLHLARARPRTARTVLNRVRLHGPFSAKALLGLGWAEWQDDQPRAAQVVWSKLAKGDPADPLVQEARLGIAQSLWRLQSHTQAVKRFRETIGLYQDQLALLEQRIGDIGDNRLLNELLDKLGRAGPDERPRLLLGSALGRHLDSLLLKPRFQATLTRYARLHRLEQRLKEDGDRLAALPADDGAAPLQRRLASLRVRIGQLRRDLQTYLQNLVMEALLAQREQLQQQLVAARYGLARLLDEMAGTEAAP